MTPRRPPVRLLLLVSFPIIAAVVWLSLVSPTQHPLKAGERPNIILIVVETMRADHLRSYGYPRLTMPILEHVASEGIVFERATSATSWTLPSVTSILTGLPPGAHGVRSYEDQIPERVETLAERLKQSGYHTAFLGVNSLFEADRKVDQGFEHYYGTDEIAGEELNEHLMAWLKSYPREKPVFLYVHYFDPHCRYEPPAAYRELYWPPDPAIATHRTMTPEQYRSMHECFQLHHGPQEPVLDVDYYLAEYDAELRHVDHLIGLFLERLKTAGLYDSSLLFVLSDHGEEFYDNGGFGHGKVLFEHQVHVPLVVRMPKGAHGGRRVSGRVSSVDLYPTALAAAGLKPSLELPGLDLTAVLEGGDASALEQRAVFSETDYEGKERAVLQGPWKLLVSPDHTRPAGLFDLRTDPGEQKDVSSDHPEEKARLMELLEVHERAAMKLGKQIGGTRQELTQQTIEQLESLGYIQRNKR